MPPLFIPYIIKRINTALMLIISTGKPYFIPAKHIILHRCQIMRREQQLRSSRVCPCIAKQFDDIAKELWVKFGVKFIKYNKSSFVKCKQDNRKCSNKFTGSVRFVFKRKGKIFAIYGMDGIKTLFFLVKLII